MDNHMKITGRLKELSAAVSKEQWRELSMRVPAEPDRDADIVLLRAAVLIERLENEAAEMRKLAFFASQALGGLDDPRRWEADKHLVQIIYSGGAKKLGDKSSKD